MPKHPADVGSAPFDFAFLLDNLVLMLAGTVFDAIRPGVASAE
jgi:hypothetical protein